MPVRSLNSAVLTWPDREVVLKAFQTWIRKYEHNPDIIRIGYYGSYARGDWGVGSDLDVLVLVEYSRVRLYERSRAFDLTELPVPADIIIYTLSEWDSMARAGQLFWRKVSAEIIWTFSKTVSPERKSSG
ncbi:nucleotidyltransferase domain-containing protein [bacterium]|nr:nucleotidyltransferase domain-containing protein [bacterium]